MLVYCIHGRLVFLDCYLLNLCEISKIDEFVEKYGQSIRNDKGEVVYDINGEELRADFRSTVESLLPAKSEINKRKNDRAAYIRELGYPMQVRVKYGDAIEETVEWLRSRLLAAIDAKDDAKDLQDKK